MEEKAKNKLVLMVIVLGLIVGANAYFKDARLFLYAFDTLAFVTMLVLLFGIKKDVGATSTPRTRRGIFWILMFGIVAPLTLVLNQFVPRPIIFGIDLFAIGLLLYLYFKGYKAEDREVEASETD